MADLARIKRNVRKMAEMQAPEEDIDGYIKSEGVTVEDVKNFVDTGAVQPTTTPTMQPSYGIGSSNYSIGGMTPSSFKVGNMTLTRDPLALQQQKAQMALENELKKKTQVADLVTKKAQTESTKQMTDAFQTIFSDYKNALDEIVTKNPEALKSGFSGGLNRIGLKVESSNLIDNYPAVATLRDNIRANATPLARSMGEKGVLTNKDIDRFIPLLIDPTTRSLDTNLMKAKSLQAQFERQGKPNKWMEPFIVDMENRKNELLIKNSKVLNIDPNKINWSK